MAINQTSPDLTFAYTCVGQETSFQIDDDVMTTLEFLG